MCPLCLASLAITLTTTTCVGAATIAIATRVAKSLARHSQDDDRTPAPTSGPDEARGGQ
jgi:hypothetical protein